MLTNFFRESVPFVSKTSLMTKDERKELLLKMLEANDRMSKDRQSYISIYATCLIQLAETREYNYASAIWSYEHELENEEFTSDAYFGCMLEQNSTDSHSEMLRGVMEFKQREVEALRGLAEEGYDYFLGIYRGDNNQIDFTNIEI
jgi:hypothetical protein